MGSFFSEDAILAGFDRRTRQGLIFYEGHPEMQTKTVDGFHFEFAVTGAISKKPYIKDNADEPSTVNPTVPRPPGFAPGSDIDVSGYEIGDVTKTHRLAYNKFCMYRPHMLLLTKDGYRRQYENLSLEDFQSAWKVLEDLSWRYYMFFNCGKNGGCSRLHKHMQIAPFLENRLAPWPESSGGSIKAPYEYILRRFEGDLGPKQVADIYGQMIEEAGKMLGLDASSSDHVPHNLILGRNWILVIPRTKPGVGGAYSNSLGMMGMVSVATDEELKCWFDQGPAEVISQLGVSTCVKDSVGTTDTNGLVELI